MTTRRAPSRIIPRAFPGIRPDEIEALIAHSSIHTYEPGTILCRENAVEDRFYMILEGKLKSPRTSITLMSVCSRHFAPVIFSARWPSSITRRAWPR